MIALAATLLALCLHSSLFLLDAMVYDIGVSNGRVSNPPEVVILGLDEAFMRDRHSYLAPRDRLAQLLRILSPARPAVVVLDVWLDAFIDGDKNNTNPNGNDGQLRSALAALKASGTKVLIADLATEELGGTSQDDASQSGSTAHGTALPFFRQAATAGASVGFKTDSDSVLRRLSPSGSLVPMPLLAARLYAQSQGKQDKEYWESLEERLRREDIPIVFCGPPGTIKPTSAEDLLNLPKAVLPAVQEGYQGKLIFIGSTYAKGRDVFRTPYTRQASDHPSWEQMYGVELLAHTTQTMLDGAPRYSEFIPSSRAFTAVLTFFLSLAIAALAVRGTRRAVSMALVALGLTALAAVLSARNAGPLWGFRFHPVADIWLAVPLSCAVAIAWREWHEALELNHVRGAFEAYVGPQVLKQLSGKMPELGGEVRPITVLFCDIRGYSALAETMRDDPVGLLRELNGHFSPLVGALQSRHAHVDNYVGDLIMALWCEPLSGHDPKRNACDAVAAALEIERLVNERNQLRVSRGLPAIEVGIGVHCGEAVVGNLGGQDGKDSKIHYTAIGDTVNLASRVESATRQFDLPLLVTREITEICGEDAGFVWEFVAQTSVKNRQQTVDVFRVGFETA